MTAYYNENDPNAAATLRELINEGLIAAGDVDEQSILDVRPNDLRGYTQCHFFAGLGCWSLALRRAGFSDDRNCWTGSPPCQPFSDIGLKGGFADERHLWPAFFHLIEIARPATVFGEQVATNDGLEWIDLVQDDMEGADYAFGAFDTCAAGFGAANIRQRLYFAGCQYTPPTSRRMGHTKFAGLERYDRHGNHARERSVSDRSDAAAGISDEMGRRAQIGNTWADADYLEDRNGTWRPVQRGSFPVADGSTYHMEMLHGIGNAINIEQATGFIRAFLEAEARGFVVGASLGDLL